MAGPVEQVGEIGACDRCGAEVMLKTTIPILGPDGTGTQHVCRPCARSLVVVGSPEPPAEPVSTVAPPVESSQA
jgi:hypothetical protein